MAAALTLPSPHRGVGGGSKLGFEADVRKARFKGSVRKDQADDMSLTPSSDDPLRILAPGQKKLSTVESQRVLAVMEEAIKRLEGVTLIPILSHSLERFSVSLGLELVGLLRDYNHLTEEYNQLYSELEQQGTAPELSEGGSSHDTQELGGSQSGSHSSLTSSGRPVRLKPLEDKAKLYSTEVEFQQVRLRLKHTIKCILRDLHRNPLPSSVQASVTSFGGIPKNVTLLQDEMSSLRGVLHEKLLTTHMEEARKKEHLSEVNQRQELAEQQIAKLEAELAEEQKKKEELITAKNTEIKRLKSNIKGVLNLSEDRNRRVKVDAQNQQMQDKQAHEAKVSKLNEEISALKKKLTEVTGDHKEKEQALRKRAFRHETELENWIQKYDHEMGEKQDELEMLEEEYAIETSQLKELEEKLEVLSVEYTAVVQEQEEARKRAEEHAQKMGQMARAARVIQRTWKQYLEKKKAAKGKKKGKKGKKGKGKGKGKKGKKKKA